MNILTALDEQLTSSKKSNKHTPRRFGYFLMFMGIAILFFSIPLQSRINAMCTKEGVYIPENHYQFSSEESTQIGKIVSHSFTIYNGRPHVMEVKANADCGCTGLSWNHTTILPFGQVNIVASKRITNSPSSVGLTFTLNNSDYVFATLKE